VEPKEVEEDLEEESPEEDPVVEPDAQVEKMRVLGRPGFDIEIQGAFATVLGDEHQIYQAGMLLERLDQKCRLLMYKDARKRGEPCVEDMVPRMMEDRRSGPAFDVHFKIASVRRVTLMTAAPEKLLGFPGWAFGEDFLVVADFEALLTAEPLPFQKIKHVETTAGPYFDFVAYDPETRRLSFKEQGQLTLAFVHGIVVEG